MDLVHDHALVAGHEHGLYRFVEQLSGEHRIVRRKIEHPALPRMVQEKGRFPDAPGTG